MAAPVTPTLNKIIREALLKAGAMNMFSRAKDSWVAEIKDDIASRAGRDGNNRLKSLQEEAMQIGVDNQRKYDFPSDWDEEISVQILKGTHTDTAQAGGGNSEIIFEAAEDISQADAEGSIVVLTAGTGNTEFKEIISYDTTTVTATLDSAWTSNPDGTTTYLVINDFHKLREGNIMELDENQNPTSPGMPEFFYKFKTNMYFDVPLDGAYPILVKYYLDIHQVNLTESSSALITRLYKNWYGVLVQGIYVKALESKRPSTEDQLKFYGTAYALYEQKLDNMLMKEETPWGGEFEMFSV